jgi:hypothetical protein
MHASPSIAPEHADVVYLVLDDLGGEIGTDLARDRRGKR